MARLATHSHNRQHERNESERSLAQFVEVKSLGGFSCAPISCHALIVRPAIVKCEFADAIANPRSSLKREACGRPLNADGTPR
jgi:hypothetical protein